MGSDLYKIDTDSTASTASSETSKSSDTSDVSAAESTSSSSSPSSGTRQEVPVPTMGESITQGVLAAWNKGVGDFVAADEVVASIETDKVL